MSEQQIDWCMAATPAGAVLGPSELPEPLGWVPATVPGTVAQALDLPLDTTEDIEDRDWWWRTTLDVPVQGAWRLHLDGLATLCEVFVGGAVAATSQSMFVPLDVPLPGGAVEVALCFRSLTASFKGRRARPRWKTALVDEQKLRFVRTSLLGRASGWMPRLPVVGPWRGVRLEPVPAAALVDRVLEATEVDGVARLRLSGRVEGAVTAVRVVLRGQGDVPAKIDVPIAGGRAALDVALPDIPLWWPHTELRPRDLIPAGGTRAASPEVREAWLELVVGGDVHVQPLPPVGFRSVRVDRAGDGFGVVVNGRRIFCRGANWMPRDARHPAEPGGAAVLEMVRHGLNMLRVPGPTLWATRDLAEACMRSGVLLWQDLPFANFDLPHDDPGFAALVDAELRANLTALQGNPAVAVLCGGSEQEQQAAMMGLPREAWSHPFTTETLPARAAALLPGVPVVPNTPTGGALPFSTGEGLTHYYGVGAYKRPLTDIRRSNLRFTPECLGFSSLPDEQHLPRLQGGVPAPHHPAWKAGVPRDSGAGWDFEDVRDHYLQQIYGLDPVGLRSVDPARYRALSRLVPGMLMARAMAEWRRPGSGCGGALVWTLQDLRPGAGWGLLDSGGRPKAALRQLGRACARRAALLTDEGLDGYAVHLHNAHPEPLEAELELLVLRHGRTVVAEARAPVSLAPFLAETRSADALLGRFVDLTHAYRFGPPGHDAVVARLRAPGGAVLHEDVAYPGAPPLHPEPADVLEARIERRPGGTAALVLESAVLLHGVALEIKGAQADDDHFDLTPGVARAVPVAVDGQPAKVWVTALNLAGGKTVRG